VIDVEQVAHTEIVRDEVVDSDLSCRGKCDGLNYTAELL